MRKSSWNIASLGLLFAASVLIGCNTGGNSPTPETPPDLEAEAAVEVKSIVLDFVDAYKKDAPAAEGNLADLYEQLETMSEDWPSTNVDVYKQIWETVQGFSDDYSKATPDAVDALAKLAEQLPGDVEAYRAEQGEEE